LPPDGSGEYKKSNNYNQLYFSASFGTLVATLPSSASPKIKNHGDATKEVVMMKSYTTTSGIDSSRFCRHLLAGVTEIPKRCLLNHECGRCGFDQWLEETSDMQRRLPHDLVAGSKALAA
jgi:hypothetical protein